MKKFLLTGILAGAVAFGIAGFIFKDNNALKLSQNLTSTNSPILTVSLTITYDNENSKTYRAEMKEGMTAYDALKIITEREHITVKVENYDMGIFIVAIGEKKNGDDNKFWLYYINGKSPSVSSSKAVVKHGDSIEFKFEKSPF